MDQSTSGTRNGAAVAVAGQSYQPSPSVGPSVGQSARTVGTACRALTTGIDSVQGVDLNGLDEERLRDLLAASSRGVRQLETTRARVAAALAGVAARQAQRQSPDDPRAAERAARDVRRELVSEHRLTPSEAKQAIRSGRLLTALPRADQASVAGDLSMAHLRSLERVLGHLHGPIASEIEAELVAAGSEQDPVTFGKTCRRRLAELDHDAAMDDLDRLHGRRSSRVAVDDAGMTHLSADIAGADAEWVHTAIHAFRRPDAEGERRTAEQATADALVEVCRAAVSTLDDPDARGARPLFLITIPDPDPDRTAEWEVGEALHTGPLPRQELERQIGIAHVAVALADARRIPTAVTSQVRTVPAGLWRALVARDGGCIAPGCDAPPAWCQVMHLGVPYRDGGQLTVETSGLGCTRHHRAIDSGHLTARLTPNGPVVDPPRRGSPHDGASLSQRHISEPRRWRR